MGEAPFSERDINPKWNRYDSAKSDWPPHQRAAVTPCHGKRVTRSSHGPQKTGESQLQSRSEFSQIELYANALHLDNLKGILYAPQRIVPESGLELGTLSSVVLHATARPILRGRAEET